VPGGEYEIRVMLVGSEGERARQVATVAVF
jgi:hypothetical protein